MATPSSQPTPTDRRYTGSCHCGAVTFTATGIDPAKAGVCNCSHCHRKGFVMVFIQPSEFTLTTGADDLVEYHFNTNNIHHTFCKHCGVEAFARGSDGKGNEAVMVNLRCIPGIDTDALTPKHYNGKDF